MNDIPPAVTLYWQEERIKELEAALQKTLAAWRDSMIAREACAAEIERLTAELGEANRLRLVQEGMAVTLAKECDRLRAALAEAIEEVESWAEYAGDYFKEKHDLQGTLKRLRESLR